MESSKDKKYKLFLISYYLIYVGNKQSVADKEEAININKESNDVFAKKKFEVLIGNIINGCENGLYEIKSNLIYDFENRKKDAFVNELAQYLTSINTLFSFNIKKIINQDKQNLSICHISSFIIHPLNRKSTDYILKE